MKIAVISEYVTSAAALSVEVKDKLGLSLKTATLGRSTTSPVPLGLFLKSHYRL